MLRPKTEEKKNGFQSKRAGKPLNESVNKRLAAYALAAGAAGVGVLALAPQPAQASIVMGTGTPITLGVNTTEEIKINGASVLGFANTFGTFANGVHGGLHAFGIASAGGQFIGSPLAKSAVIGPGGAFTASAALASGLLDRFPVRTASKTIIQTGTSIRGPWANRTGYLGFEFRPAVKTAYGYIPGSKSYFGWAHLSVHVDPGTGVTGLISSFAYDNVAGQTILAGEGKPTPTAAEPGALTLSLLAVGAVGLYELRRRKLSAGSDQSSAA